jgi:hypothetical protein
MNTAVEWLLFELSKNGLLPDGIPSDIHNQAKEMEKEQRGYSEEEVRKLCNEAWFKIPIPKTILKDFDKWFEKVKKNKSEKSKSCSCDGGIIVCPGCNGDEHSEFGVCAGCHGKGKVVCGKCGGK